MNIRTIGSRKRMVLEVAPRRQSVVIKKYHQEKYCYPSALNLSDFQCLL